jgi:NAD(P)-dependent dehydrogenase (short-subunit alcohol dehydrogenase family)
MAILPMTLEGKVGVVTGAGGRLGRMISLAMAHAGADLVLVDIRSEHNQETADQLRSAGKPALAVTADVNRVDDIRAVRARCLEAHGRIDVLVNNAGISPIYKRAEHIAEETWDAILRTNLKSVFLWCQVVGEVMREQKSGRIVNIASVNGAEGSPRVAAYAASKAGVMSLTRTLAREWAPHNVTVNSVAPGYFEVGLGEPMLANEWIRGEIVRQIPLGRLGRQEEIAGAVVFLASEAASYITGQILAVDGGWLA